MRFRIILSSLLIIRTGLFAGVAMAQTDTPAGVDPEPAASDSELEEVIVRGSPTLRGLRAQIHRAEEKVHARFNELNDDDEYDIHCHTETPKGTRISQRVCKANFVDSATTAEGQAFLASVRGEFGGAQPPAQAVIARKNEVLRRKMTELVNEDAELREAIMQFNELSENYRIVRQQMFDGE